MGYYSRQTCGAMIRTVFRNVAEQLMAAQAAADMGQVRTNRGQANRQNRRTLVCFCPCGVEWLMLAS